MIDIYIASGGPDDHHEWANYWAQGWAAYGKVFAAMVIMAAFFSTIMTMVAQFEEHVLVWQKGAIKW